MSEQEAWWQVAFGAHYQTVYQHRSDEDAEAEVAGIRPMLEHGSAGPILDACCGMVVIWRLCGRWALPAG